MMSVCVRDYSKLELLRWTFKVEESDEEQTKLGHYKQVDLLVTKNFFVKVQLSKAAIFS